MRQMTRIEGWIRTVRRPARWLAVVAVATLVTAGCQRPGAGEAAGAGAESSALAAENEHRLAEERAQAAAAELQAAEERERQAAEERERLAAVEHELAAEEARLAAQRRALEAERGRLALQERERELAAREAELREHERLAQEQAALEATEREAAELERAEQARVAAAAEAERQRAAAEAAREPEIVEASLEVGAVLEVEMLERLSSRTAAVGDVFETRIARDILNTEGQVVIPVDSVIYGRVTEAKPLRKVGGQSALGVEFTDLELPDGERVAIHASYVELGRDKRGDKKKIGIAAAAGAVLGGLLGGDVGGAAAGAAVGAAAGTAVVATRKGEDVEFLPGELLAMRLEEVVTVRTEMLGVAR